MTAFATPTAPAGIVSTNEAISDLYAALTGQGGCVFDPAYLITNGIGRGILQFCTRGQWFSARVCAPSDHPAQTDSAQATVRLVQSITGISAPFIDDVNAYLVPGSGHIVLRLDKFDALVVIG